MLHLRYKSTDSKSKILKTVSKICSIDYSFLEKEKTEPMAKKTF